ncbi:BglG family transcription antiterminator [Isobaculum melis]|uniref:Lichenan operon transcriptional antiterminator n=1 Tax=Isobaculum melis TaxID=142588 RepID=A0A1H9SMT8_9LACT|nr:PTS sugar transporter subunit IIA [Isobaculum melis]SER86322.1 lichenan operon transcriptional antiterminator [Isobaculum melis]
MNSLKRLLELLQKNEILSMQVMKQELNFSERKIRELLKELRQLGEKNGFKVTTIVHQGYLLEIESASVFERFLEQLNGFEVLDVENKKYRQALMIYMLLENKGYITLSQIAEVLDISRNTVMSDIDAVKHQLKSEQLTIQSKSHYGLRLEGDEYKRRKLFSKIIKQVVELENLPLQYFEFIKTLDFTEVKEAFHQLLRKYNMQMTHNTIESIMIHLKILLFRMNQNNEITEVKINRDLIGEDSYQLTKELVSFLEEKFQVEIREEEIDLIASQIYGKATSNKVPKEKELEMKAAIDKALIQIDQEYATAFSKDALLQECLLLHVYPLLLRVSFGLELTNSLITSISAQYTNSFLVSLRFIEYHDELRKYPLSRDEIGYLALHFAAHQERKNQEILSGVRNILILSDARRSKTFLLKVKVESQFPEANIVLKTQYDLTTYQMDEIDLILSTIKIPEITADVPIVLISEELNESKLKKIKNTILFHQKKMTKKVPKLQNLFHKELFFIEEATDYLEIIERYANKLVEKGYAHSVYPASVLERERKFTTVYENGIAGPHGMSQNANIDSIAVIILKHPVQYEEKEVKCIFLLNIRKNYLFLHQEISNFMMKMIQDTGLANALAQSKSFAEFTLYAKKAW